RLHLVGLGVAVVRWAALDDVGDVDIGAGEPHCLDHLGQELARFADERLTLDVLVVAWAFADEDDARVRIADAEDDVLAAAREFAALAVPELVAHDLEGEGAARWGGSAAWGLAGGLETW